MVVTDEQLEAMCEAHFECALSEDMWSWSKLPEYKRRARRRRMRAALAVLPQPASAAMPNEGRIADAIRVHIACDSSDAHAAAKAISLLARRNSTDEAEALRKSLACSRDRMRVTAERLDAADRHIADIEGELGEVRDYCAERGQDRDERAVTAVTAVVSWLEYQLARLTAERDGLQGAQVLNRNAIAGLKRERDEALAKLAARLEPVEFDEGWVGAMLEQEHHACMRDNATLGEVQRRLGACALRVCAVARLQAQLADARTKVSGRDAIIVDQNKQLASLREQLAARPEPVVIDEALAERFLKALRRDGIGTDHGRVIVDALSVKEAMRRVLGDRASVSVPQGDPYAGIANEGLTDEQLAEASRSPDERLIARLNADLAYSRKTLDGVLEQRDQLRAELEKTRAALAATQGELEDALGNRDLQQLRDELTDCKSRLEGYERSNRELRDKWNAELREVGRLGLELKEARAGLEACRERRDELEQTCESQDEELAQLREQHEALRAACAITPAERSAMSFWPNQHSKECAQLETLQSYACRVERAMLKPAPAEAEPVRCDFGDECPGHASPDDRPCGWEPASPADALRPNDRHGMVGAAEQVLCHASEPDCEPIADWVAKRGLPCVPASLKPLTERVERLERALRDYLDDLLGAKIMTDLEAEATHKAIAALASLDARKGADRG